MLGYGNKNGILSPYQNAQYHLKEFSDCPLENARELFNLHHSSLWTTFEQGFGVLKKRLSLRCRTILVIWNTSGSSFSMLCHSYYIMRVDSSDYIIEVAMNQVDFNDREPETCLRQDFTWKLRIKS